MTTSPGLNPVPGPVPSTPPLRARARPSHVGVDTPVLRVENLTVRYEPRLGTPMTAVKDMSLTVREGEFVGLVGESGSGKTTFAQAALRLLRRPGRVTEGRIWWGEEDVTNASENELRPHRWAEVSTVFQSSMNSLNPVVRIRKVFADVIHAHTDLDEDAVDARAAELFEMVRIDPSFLRMYPHELSGGMRQRVNLALALALQPRFVLFDEPTTGLDVVVQKQILDEIRRLQTELHFGAILISHDMGTILDFSDRVAIMLDGELVEDVGTETMLRDGPRHPYSVHLLGSYGELLGEEVAGYSSAGLKAADEREEVVEKIQEKADVPTIVEVSGLHKRYEKRNGLRTEHVDAVKDVSFTLRKGEVTALVGQSGSGKSTIARIITTIEKPTSGTVTYSPDDGSGPWDITRLDRRQRRTYANAVQYVFQDPYAALNPALTVAYQVMRPLQNYRGMKKQEAMDAAADLLEQVGLSPAPAYLTRLPYELSGGQRQRIVIARALAPDPQLLIADEPIASLDVSIRAEILELLQSLVLTRGWGCSTSPTTCCRRRCWRTTRSCSTTVRSSSRARRPT
ncbi:ABC transporter ATP-binding protein [Serinibacter arcticus]|uniref:ABC transporter ATP-binding protein n=1 Tax=Serinibacter arcticus TaxID=1655435 RepID=UPI001F365175|nr:ABC transporter ATP-binding protein [Serinibacter arcticus]